MANLPKFEQKLTEKIVNPSVDQAAHPTYGIVLAYDQLNNTAQVLISNKGSEEPGQVLNDVVCPVYAGVQNVAPERGRPCLVVFKDNTYQYPMITHYFNHVFNSIDYNRHYTAINTTPRFMFQA